MIPLKDENPTERFPIVTVLLMIACTAVYFLVQHGGIDLFGSAAPEEQNQRELEQIEFNFGYAAIPEEVVDGEPLTVREVAENVGDFAAVQTCDVPFQESEFGTVRVDASDFDRECFPDKNVWLALFSSMFLHGGLLHLGGNMLFLWVFGNNIEDHMGPIKYLVFYLFSGLAASGAHILFQPDSTVPVVGASGAIAGVMGAYLIWFPNAQIKTLLIYFFIFIRDISAKWLLGFWFVLQFFTNANEGVAWVAHVGGFIFGVLVALLIRASRSARETFLRYDDIEQRGGGFRRSDDWRDY